MPSFQGYLFKQLIRRSNLFGTEPYDLIQLREGMEQKVGNGRPQRHVKINPVTVDGISAEWVVPRGAPEDRVILYLHGGAWFMGSTKTHRLFVAKIAKASNIRGLSINYRLAPEHPFPAGLEDCRTAYLWLLKQGISAQNIIIAGDSAGGNLTLALLPALRDASQPLPAGAVAISPATDLTFSGESTRTRRQFDPLFGHLDGADSFIVDYLGDNDARNPLISPLYADLHGLPPLLLQVGEDEILLDDTLRFTRRAQEAGLTITTTVWHNMFHVFQMFAPFLPEARLANKQIAKFIRDCLKQ